MTVDGLLIVTGGMLLGVVVPVVFVFMLAPALSRSDSGRTENYRGRRVFHGLGIVWFVWAGCALVGGVTLTRGPASVLGLLTLAGPLALVAFAAGVIDDAFGSSDARGFRGHLKAMARGRLTTGGLKLIAIGVASLAVALVLAEVAPWGATTDPWGVRRLGGALMAGAAIALTANLMNLTDLRPGRALKVYALLVTGGALSATLLLGASLASAGLPSDLAQRGVEAVALVLFVAGPAIAVGRYDFREQGMLGDAGANPMGAVAGLLIVSGLPLWGLALYLVGVVALNLASERISFSRVIERSDLLSRIDGWGRDTEGRSRAAGETSPDREAPSE